MLDSSVVADLRHIVVEAGRQMAGLGLVAGTWGNISVRNSVAGPIAITPSGRPYNEISTSDIVILDKEGQILDGSNPSSETPLHLAIYKSRPDVRGIVHTHSLYATACAVAGVSIPPCLEELVQAVGGGVEVAAYALPGTTALADAVVSALSDRSAALMSNHGVVACGPTLREALLVAQLVEKAAHVHSIAAQLGNIRRLSDDDICLMRNFYREKYMQR